MTNTNTPDTTVGVVGVGSMGQNHARVYRELPSATLVGVADADEKQAREVAEKHGVAAMSLDDLLDAVDAVSIAAPTQYHYDIAEKAIDRGVHLLVEKPFVDDIDRGWDLVERADDAGVTLQVGHIERFNPAVVTLRDIASSLDIIAIDAHRLGPPVDRDITHNVVYDLMIHDIDVLLSLAEGEITSLSASSALEDRYVTATAEFDSGLIGTLTASRVTQQKVRTLSINAEDCWVDIDYLTQSVEIHRRSVPEYIERNGDVRYRHESIVEHPNVVQGEPLRFELEAFVEAVETGETPVVSGEDGMRALEIATRIDQQTTRRQSAGETTQTQ
ncbi:Gfo/Idh/MocA family oxidoreductase [Halogeometricum luteum]|uniref:Gfo/Idh/MocA family oxidoreductase n=1 Tax=Halogeometricum luteum TaxID=2950537 RepID=A0ABU2G386_9EURY|nr:Gfo/Idh/MocA family oxidoreductase [Halogeometricum sp. S3BR5-2]MDS0295244.1 Gfo/Idh/MocA family oxidoreductase [Halogeometricum sp. S3BR5-2]